MAPTEQSIAALLERIQKNAGGFAAHFTSQDLPEPSFEDGDNLRPGEELPADVASMREAAIEAAQELHDLLLGPLGLVVECSGQQYLLLAIQFLYRHRIAYSVPLDGEATFADIAKECSLHEQDVARFLRVATSQHVFREVRKGVIVHNAASRVLLNNPMLEAWTMNIAQEFWPALARTVDANNKWPGSEEPNETGYSLANGTNENPFDVIKKDPKRHEQFVQAMSFSHLHPSYNAKYLVESFDFGSIGRGTIVDVGGSQGQDSESTIAGLNVPKSLSHRILGMQHDFMTPQPIRGADIYLLRWILHDWSDKYAIKILKNLIPGLKAGAMVVVNDICIPEPGQLSSRAERHLRLMDISMKAFNNARERDAESWERLFSMADERFEFKGITLPKDARMAIITAEWKG